MSIYRKVVEDQNTSIFANVDISKDTVVFSLKELSLMTTNNRFAIRKNDDVYYNTLNSDVRFVNHSCNPNLVFSDLSEMFYANKNIQKDTELTYDYETTETWFVEPFHCKCKEPNCRGRIGYVLKQIDSHYPFLTTIDTCAV